MSNIGDVKPQSVEIILDRTRHLRYDLNSFAAIEERYGDIEEAMRKMEKGNIVAIRMFLWAGLIHEDESLTEKQVGSMILVSELPKFAEVIRTAMHNSLPEEEEAEAAVIDPNA